MKADISVADEMVWDRLDEKTKAIARRVVRDEIADEIEAGRSEVRTEERQSADGRISDWKQQTRRDLEVLRYVADGRSNQEIADALYVSVPTVKTHLGRVLAKLGLRDRAQVVVYAYEAGLIVPAHRPKV